MRHDGLLVLDGVRADLAAHARLPLLLLDLQVVRDLVAKDGPLLAHERRHAKLRLLVGAHDAAVVRREELLHELHHGALAAAADALQKDGDLVVVELAHLVQEPPEHAQEEEDVVVAELLARKDAVHVRRRAVAPRAARVHAEEALARAREHRVGAVGERHGGRRLGRRDAGARKVVVEELDGGHRPGLLRRRGVGDARVEHVAQGRVGEHGAVAGGGVGALEDVHAHAHVGEVRDARRAKAVPRHGVKCARGRRGAQRLGTSTRPVERHARALVRRRVAKEALPLLVRHVEVVGLEVRARLPRRVELLERLDVRVRHDGHEAEVGPRASPALGLVGRVLGQRLVQRAAERRAPYLVRGAVAALVHGRLAPREVERAAVADVALLGVGVVRERALVLVERGDGAVARRRHLRLAVARDALADGRELARHLLTRGGARTARRRPARGRRRPRRGGRTRRPRAGAGACPRPGRAPRTAAARSCGAPGR